MKNKLGRRNVFLLLLLSCSLLGLRAQGVVCTKGDSARVVALLTEARRQPAKTNWMLWFGRKFIGVPYVGGTLDKGRDEQLVVNLHELDCTTYVEQVMALTLCAEKKATRFADFCNALRHVRYIGGRVAYTARQHYFTAWINDNVKEGLVTDIQQPNPPFSAVQKIRVNWMTTHVSSYKMLSAPRQWLGGIRDLENSINGKRYRYIPKRLLHDSSLLRRCIKNGDILVMITSKKGLDTAHIGIAVWGRDGQLHLLNASSLHHRVIEEPRSLYEYQQRQRTQIGIRVCRVR